MQPQWEFEASGRRQDHFIHGGLDPDSLYGGAHGGKQMGLEVHLGISNDRPVGFVPEFLKGHDAHAPMGQRHQHHAFFLEDVPSRFVFDDRGGQCFLASRFPQCGMARLVQPVIHMNPLLVGPDVHHLETRDAFLGPAGNGA